VEPLGFSFGGPTRPGESLENTPGPNSSGGTIPGGPVGDVFQGGMGKKGGGGGRGGRWGGGTRGPRSGAKNRGKFSSPSIVSFGCRKKKGGKGATGSAARERNNISGGRGGGGNRGSAPRGQSVRGSMGGGGGARELLVGAQTGGPRGGSALLSGPGRAKGGGGPGKLIGKYSLPLKKKVPKKINFGGGARHPGGRGGGNCPRAGKGGLRGGRDFSKGDALPIGVSSQIQMGSAAKRGRGISPLGGALKKKKKNQAIVRTGGTGRAPNRTMYSGTGG